MSSAPYHQAPDSQDMDINIRRHPPIQPAPSTSTGLKLTRTSAAGTATPEGHGNDTFGRAQAASLPSLSQLGLPPLQSMTGRYALQNHYSGGGRAYDVAESSESEGAQTDNAGGQGQGSQSPNRKMQNLVAQRALRKRRAARVSQLEAELERQKVVHRKGDDELTDQIGELELELASYQSKCRLLEEMLDQERTERLRAEIEVQSFKRPHARDKDASPAL